jgi:hypothetical protein
VLPLPLPLPRPASTLPFETHCPVVALQVSSDAHLPQLTRPHPSSMDPHSRCCSAHVVVGMQAAGVVVAASTLDAGSAFATPCAASSVTSVAQALAPRSTSAVADPTMPIAVRFM